MKFIYQKKFKTSFLVIIVIIIGLIAGFIIVQKSFQSYPTMVFTDIKKSAPASIEYKDSQYGFNFSLPLSWQGYSIIISQWEGYTSGQQGDVPTEKGPLISIRHPKWTSQNPRQDIPILVFSLRQWNDLQQEKFHIGAAPIRPRELGRNAKYVLALPARYNFSFLIGFEEVDKIFTGNPLQAY